MWLPGMREVMTAAGCVKANRSDMVSALNSRRGIVVVPGGNREGLLTPPGTILRRRRPAGCVKMAIDAGAWVVPVYDATVDSMYDVYLPFGPFLYRWIGFPWPLFVKGRGWFSLAPRGTVMRLVIGNPISTLGKTAETVEQERMDALHQLKEMYGI
jgi:1-acyl-sn-glycerol-3-phosphate acyltransferase